jgi:hypothetical protein
MALYLGDKPIDVVFEIKANNSLEEYINRVKTSVKAEELEGIVNIKEYAFYKQTLLKTVVLPSTVQTIGNYAFDGCTKISYIRFLSETPPTIGNQALPTGGGMIWYVPKGCLEVYKNADGFSKYPNYLREW